jgi:hypothetical protein
MNVGQKVLLIGTWEWFDCIPPPIGAVGEITEPIDEDGDYLVLFPEHPCPVGDEPDWFAPHWALVPIDDEQEPTSVRVVLADQSTGKSAMDETRNITASGETREQLAKRLMQEVAEELRVERECKSVEPTAYEQEQMGVPPDTRDHEAC